MERYSIVFWLIFFYEIPLWAPHWFEAYLVNLGKEDEEECPSTRKLACTFMKRDEIDQSESDEVQEEADEVDGEMVFEFEVWYRQRNPSFTLKVWLFLD